MRREKFRAGIFLIYVFLAVGSRPGCAQGTFELVAGKAFDSAVPKDFYLEGNAILTEKRNAALLKNPAGARVVLALINTSGYSSQIREKYTGMIIAEGKVSVCGNPLSVGSYGFGLARPSPASNENAKFNLYNQAGEKVAECSAKKDLQLKQPRPLQIILSKQKVAHIYLGRYSVGLE
jgi:hypothetical protein